MDNGQLTMDNYFVATCQLSIVNYQLSIQFCTFARYILELIEKHIEL